ncbi:MAG: CPBP family intramembrane metalloprotease, partial [Lachnospiraceae bacterium]|nr:CPBP family intramembrane metalloprotease [Lachnospiraceae bacterium]
MENKLKWYHGLLTIALFGGVMALEYFGLLGRGVFTTVLGELLFAVAAVIVVLIARAALPSVFRFKRVRFLSLVGVYMMWRALITVGVFLTETAIYFFPKLGESSDGVTDLITNLSFPMAILVIAILPAVCEEILFRGPILRSLEFIKIPALIIVVDGLIFAAAHLSFIKMIPITILGIYLAYLVYSSGNMFYSMFVHFINNSLSVILVYTLLGLG